jgi:hypothetical protein
MTVPMVERLGLILDADRNDGKTEAAAARKK